MTQGVKITKEEKEDAKAWYIHCKQIAMVTGTNVTEIYWSYGVNPTHVTKIRTGNMRGPINWRNA